MLAIAKQRNVNRIARGTGLVKRNHPVLTQQAVHEGRFAHVWATNDGDFRVIRIGFVSCLRERRQHVFDQLAYALAVRRRDRNRIAQSQFMEFSNDHILIHAFSFIDRNADWHTTGNGILAQPFANDLVLRRQPLATVNDKNDCVGFCDRLQSLLGHLMHDAFGYLWLKSAGIHNQIGSPGTAPVTIMSVTRQARHVCDDRITCFCEAIKQHGFADVGSTNDDDSGFHICGLPRRSGRVTSR